MDNIILIQFVLFIWLYRYQYNSKEPTGTCAVLVTDHHRSLCANLGAANCFTIDHIREPENKKLVNSAQFYYISVSYSTFIVKEIAILQPEIMPKYDTDEC